MRGDAPRTATILRRLDLQRPDLRWARSTAGGWTTTAHVRPPPGSVEVRG